MQQPNLTPEVLRIPLAFKFLDCVFVVTAVYNSYNTLFLQPFSSSLPVFLGFLNPIMTVTGLFFCILYPIKWQRKEYKGNIDSVKLHAWFIGIIRYWLVISICSYGFAKILGTQFVQSFSRSDSLVRNLSGYDLTWNYFAYSAAMSTIIAIFQIGGAVLILFRRTTLLGVAILLPLMFNILLINWFYGITDYAFLNSILYTLGLFYLLILRQKDIRAVLFQTSGLLPKLQKGFPKYIFKFLAIAYPIALIFYLSGLKSSTMLIGKWRVDEFVRNRDTLSANSWLTDSLVWKNIYLEEYGVAVLSPNPYMVEKDKSYTGKYEYDSSVHKIRFILGHGKTKKDTLNATVNFIDSTHMNWAIISTNDTLSLQLSKVKTGYDQ